MELSQLTKPKFSMTIAIRNKAKTIAEVLHGLQEQPNTDFKLITCDGQPSNDKWRILEEAAERDPRLRFLDNPCRFKGNELEKCIQLSIAVALAPHTLLDLYFSAQSSGSLVSLLTRPFWRRTARGEQQA